MTQGIMDRDHRSGSVTPRAPATETPRDARQPRLGQVRHDSGGTAVAVSLGDGREVVAVGGVVKIQREKREDAK